MILCFGILEYIYVLTAVSDQQSEVCVCVCVCVFQVWPTVCWPLCHPGMDSSQPSSLSSSTFFLAPPDTSQSVRPVYIGVFVVRLFISSKCVVSFNVPIFSLSLQVRSQSCVWWLAQWWPDLSQTRVLPPTSQGLKAWRETSRECWWRPLWPSLPGSCRLNALTAAIQFIPSTAVYLVNRAI